MKFKPLVSEDEFRTAEAEIEAATQELARLAEASKTATAVSAQPAASAEPPQAPAAEVRPEIRTRIIEPSFGTKALAMIGFKSGLRRVRMVNKIARTVSFGCARGLAEQPKEFATVAAIYTMASDPKTAAEELPIALGWIQSLVFLSCQSVTLTAVRAA